MEKLHFDSTVTLRNGMKMPVMGYSTEIHSENWRSQMDFFEEAIERRVPVFQHILYGSVSDSFKKGD